jgi:hypothetical protein
MDSGAEGSLSSRRDHPPADTDARSASTAETADYTVLVPALASFPYESQAEGGSCLKAQVLLGIQPASR